MRIQRLLLALVAALAIHSAWATGPAVVQVTARNVLSFATLPATHDAVIVVVTGDYGTDPTVSDNQGNAYTKIVTAGWQSGGHDNVTLYWCQSIGPPSGTFTVSLGTGNWTSYALMEVSGAAAVDVATAKPYDVTGISSYTMTSGAPNAQVNELVIAALASGYAASPLGFADPSSGYTRWWLADLDSDQHASSVAYKITSSIETSSAAWSWTTGDQVGAVIVTFKGSVASVVAQAEASSISGQTSLTTGTPLNVQGGDRFCAVVASESSVPPTLIDSAGDVITELGEITPESGYYLYQYEVVRAAANAADTFTASGTNIHGIAVLQLRGLVSSSMYWPPAPSAPANGNATWLANPQVAPGTGADSIRSGPAASVGGPAASVMSTPAMVIGFTAIPSKSASGVNAAPNAGTGFTAQPGVWQTWGGGAGDYLGVFETKQISAGTSPVAATFTAPTYGSGAYGTFEWIVPQLQ